jgi:hypothetical protein
MKTKIAVCGALLWSALVVAAPCTDRQGVEFTDVQGGKGYFLIGHYGQSGFSAYLRAKDLSFPDGEFGGFFKLDGVTYQHVFVPRAKYLGAPLELEERAELQHHHEWELAHLHDTAKRRRDLKLGEQRNYGAVESETHSGAKRLFWIWDAQIADAQQIWVTTRVPDGIVALSALGYTAAQEPEVRDVVNQYMYRFDACRPAADLPAPP